MGQELLNVKLNYINRLLDTSYSAGGLQSLVDTAADIFKNPVYVVDLQNRYIAVSSEICSDNPYLQDDCKTMMVGEECLTSIRRNRIAEMVRKTGEPYYYVSDIVGKGMLVDALTIQGIEVGHIMMVEQEREFTDLDHELFHVFSKMVSIEFQKDSTNLKKRGIMYSYYLGDLLKNQAKDATEITTHLKQLGFQRKDTYYIVAIPPIGFSATNIKLDIILDSIHHIFPGSIYVIYEDTVVFLIGKSMYQDMSSYEIERLEEYLKANELKAGISNFYQELEDTPRFFKQAVDSVRLGIKLKDSASIYYYKDYYLYRMLESAEKEDSNIRFLIHPGVMKLYYYDLEKNSQLILTLKEYLKCPSQSSTIAQNLHIHKNTFLYRIGKIKEITGCELVQGDDFMSFNLSIKIMEYLGMIPS